MRIGINTLLLTWPFTNRSKSLFRKAKDWGFDTIEFGIGDPWVLDPAALRRELDKVGLACGSICGIFGPDRDLRGTPQQQRNSLKYLRAIIDQAVVLGAKTIAGPVYSSVGRAEATSRADYRKQWKTVVNHLRDIGDYAEGKGVQIAIEPLNRFETDFINTAEQAVALAEAVDNPAVGVMLDTFHMNIEEKNPAKAIVRTGKLLKHLHACGCDRGTPGNDHIDWLSITSALRKVKYEGDVVIESFTPKVEMIARAASIWRDFEPSPAHIAMNGLKFLRASLPTQA